MPGSTSPEMDGLARAEEIRDRKSPALQSRLAYWSPVLVCMVLFAQVSFLGLRPALCERRRLAEAEATLQARHAQDLVLHDTVRTALRARSDPIFLERQRRQRLLGPVAARE
jgi:hypothetical protein